MAKILFVNACVRPNSRTLQLARCALSRISGEVEEVTLYGENLSPLTLEELGKRDTAAKNKDFSDEIFRLPKQFAEAEIIVFAAPYWDLTFPSIVKNYLEKITVNGLTFAYGERGIPHGLCKAKKLIYVTTAGGPITYNFGYEYVKTLATCFYGISDVQLIKAEGLDVFGANVPKIMEDAKNSVKV